MVFSSRFLVISLFLLLALAAQGKLSNENFYQRYCPSLPGIVKLTMEQAIRNEKRIGAAILRLFFHDCFVNGCDASILLDDTATFTGEKNAFPNQNSLRGFGLIDNIKSKVEAKCNATVSCADILALAARDAVVLMSSLPNVKLNMYIQLDGPSWNVELGRRDSRTASRSAANSQLPSPFANLSTLISTFKAKGLNASEMTALSGAHTIGLAKCAAFQSRISNESNIDPRFASQRRTACKNGNILVPLDAGSEKIFDNEYYKNLVARRGLLHSDQELFNGGSQDSLVKIYSKNPNAFAHDFAAAMVKMGSISPLTGKNGEIRLNCRVVN